MRQDVVATISVARQKYQPQLPDGVGHVASRHGRSYRFGGSSSSPQAGTRLAFGVGEAFGSGFSRGLFVDTKGPDLHGDPLGVVRREVAHPAILPRPQGRHGDGRPDADTGGDLSGVSQDVDDLDRRAVDDAHRRVSPTHAIGPLRTVRGLRISGLRRRRQPSRIAPHRIQRGSGFRPPKRVASCDRRRGRNRIASRGDGHVLGRPATVVPARRSRTARRCG